MPYDFVASAIAAASGLLGVAVGGYFAAHNQMPERQQARIREQLIEFYSPMLGLRTELRVKKELSVKITGEADAAWREMIEEPYKSNNVDMDYVGRVMRERGPQFEKLIDYQNRQLGDEAIPSYRKMVGLFASKMHLAEPSTIQHFATLLEFVEIWDRWLDQSLPAEVLRRLDHSEAKLFPFYEDLADTFARMQYALREEPGEWHNPTREKVQGPALEVNPFAAAKRNTGMRQPRN